MDVFPEKLWKDCQEATEKLYEALRIEDQFYVNLCSNHCTECTARLKLHYKGHLDEFEKTWKELILDYSKWKAKHD